MNYSSRIKRIEEQAGRDDGAYDITVDRCFDRDIEPEYAEHRAREVLGIRPEDEQVQQIHVVDTEVEEKYQDMTPEQAKEILNHAR